MSHDKKMETRRILSFCFVLFTCLLSGSVLSQLVNVQIDISKPISKITKNFVGIAMNSSFVKENWKYFDLKSVRIQTLAEGLAPAYFRIGGTDADFVLFSGSGSKPTPGDNNERFDPVNFTMSEASWDTLHRFLHKVGWSLVFDLNSLYRTNGIWNSSNAEALIRYSILKNYTMAGWELGNEPGEYLRKFGVNLTVQQLVQDYEKLHSILSKAPPHVRGRILIGPSTIPLVQPRVVKFFNEFLQLGGSKVVSSPNFHHYYLDAAAASLQDFMDPDVLDGLQVEINQGNEATRKFAGGKQLWIGETSSAWGGGAKGLSDGFVAAFMWLDKLGLAARSGVGGVIRQTFYGANYGLVDHVTKEPNPTTDCPDYWLTYMYKKLVGEYVFQTVSSDPHRKVRFYAHCAGEGLPPGSLILYGMNLYSSNVTLKVKGQFNTTEMKVYLMTSSDGNLRSK
uniref:Heparanase-like n=1 Tax=Crassostrea virginica TaxID=6565 RepID=A0A8B8CZQ4_CRAVI|nr:heparanase-like [Crassostrea virginica]